MAATMVFPSLVTKPLIIVSVIFPILSLLSIVARYQARRSKKQPLEADDWLIVVTWILTLGVSINFWVFADIIGIDDVKGDPLLGTMNSLKCILIASCLLQIPLATVKISILLFYKRIFSTPKFGYLVWATISLVSAWGIIFFLLVLFEGDPISASWGMPGRMRFDSPKLGFAQVGTSIALDVFILCFPIPVISRLHLETKRKVAVGLIFMLGSFCCVAAIVRLALLRQAIYQVVHSQGHNMIYIQSKNCIFMILEANCSTIAACLPTMGPLFRGGRSQMSLVASVRSLFSLRSQGSEGSGRHYAGIPISKPSQNNSATESETELKTASALQGHAHGQSRVVVERLSQHSDEEAGYEAYGGINVTKDVEVTRT